MRYFVAVAEELGIGRAAQRLGIAQPPLSRALQRMERRFGAELFDRTPRGVVLTRPGEVLLRESRAALAAIEAAERRTRRAVEGPEALALAVKAGTGAEQLATLLDAYAAEPGAARVDLVLTEFGETETALRDGRADVGLLHLPFEGTAGLDHLAIGAEELVALVPSGHAVAQNSSTTTAEVAAVLPPPRWRGPDGQVPDGPGPVVRDQVQLVHLVALGRTAAVVPAACARSAATAGVAVLPLRDAGPVTVALAWPAHGTSRAVRDLVAVAAR
ncbi:DNA-binding transcriptional LysR family regulator [Kineococcus rhizosphaerae]|uniref:DNA-binding transcriptional LysR family regulator n=2 Tax=Kineococcus rhizosphaerae TaxID=559628 RepID=A0A2T0R660_9ACTN|nr:DNA-binding transcriptional LysR family regulator [Kineococcus rhizosphaerae]